MGDLVSIPGLGRSPGEEKGYPFQYSGLENSLDCVVHGVTESRTSLSDFHFHSYFHDYILLMVLIYRVDIKKKNQLSDFPGGVVDKNPPANAGDTGSITGLGSFRTPQSS